MTSQASDILSQFDDELVEVLDSPIIQGPLSYLDGYNYKARRYSKVWHHTPVDRNEVILNSKSKSVWRCKYCSTEYQEFGGTTAVSNHLKLRHDIDISSVQEARTVLMQANIAEAFKKA
ncbi:hypothetical protein POJ06DRAFT_177302, partial [Lipomyces tetrasporus]